MDIVRQKQIREWALLGLVGTMALVANLPPWVLERIGVEQGLLMAMLGLMVVFALFLYVRFFFFLLYFLLAIGANLPEQWAHSLGISQVPMLIALIAMVALSVLNYTAKALPSGLEPKKSKENPEATQMMIDAIAKRNLSYFKTLLTMDFDVNLPGADGFTPLMHAAQKGEFKMVQMLIKRGASALPEGPAGRASDVALKGNFPKVAEFLGRVETVHGDAAAKMAPKQQEPTAAIA
ncbi:MAG: ankyrin repeat domain-containing protein [Rhodocyclales bacterium]|nr:ankyrin repeat domain-containing protein [Rhodocyclales bacterium]